MFKGEKRGAAVIEDEARGRSHFARGPNSWCWFERGELCWTATTFGNSKMPGQVWRKSFPLPDGVSVRDVPEKDGLVPDGINVTLYTARDSRRLDCDSGRWSPPVPLSESER